MPNEDETPDLHEALERTRPRSPKGSMLPEDFPPPPKDWTSYPIARAIWVLILLAVVFVAIWKGPAWFAFLSGHPYGLKLAVFVLVGIVLIISLAYWSFRAKGETGMQWWNTDRKDKPR